MRTFQTTGSAHGGKHVRGFTLIEAALATVIIGVGVTAMMELFSACTKENRAAGQSTVAMMLTENIRELMEDLAFNDPTSGRSVFGAEVNEELPIYDDVDDFDLSTFNPPINAARQPLTQLSQYTQVVSVMPVYPTMPSANTNESSPSIPKTTYTGAARVRIRILYRQNPSAVAQEVYRASWTRCDQ
jgi:type II secretory pathway pseudopilin PulG